MLIQICEVEREPRSIRKHKQESSTLRSTKTNKFFFTLFVYKFSVKFENVYSHSRILGL